MTNIFNQQHFDYEMLDREAQIIVEQKTAEIKDLIRQAARDIVEMGQKLAEVKQQLKHGEFRNWLRSEFNWSVSSATKFMQVSSQFNNINLSDLNFSTSSLYILAAPSTPESARQHALKIANQGENITYSLAKSIVKSHRESAENNSASLDQVNSMTAEGGYAQAKALAESEDLLGLHAVSLLSDSDFKSSQEAGSVSPTMSRQVAVHSAPLEQTHRPKVYPLGHSQAPHVRVTRQSNVQYVPTMIDCDDCDCPDITEESDKIVRILEIKQEQPKYLEDRIQDFEIVYAGICVMAQGSPKDLTVLFRQMQNHPQFAKDILEQAKLSEC